MRHLISISMQLEFIIDHWLWTSFCRERNILKYIWRRLSSHSSITAPRGHGGEKPIRCTKSRPVTSLLDGESEVKQLCDTTGSSGVESALHWARWVLIQNSSGSWMDDHLHTHTVWRPLVTSPSSDRSGAGCCEEQSLLRLLSWVKLESLCCVHTQCKSTFLTLCLHK